MASTETFFLQPFKTQQAPGAGPTHADFGNGARQLGATSGRADSRDAALPDIRRALECYLAFIGDDGWALHFKHMAWSKEQSARWRRQREGSEAGGYG